LFITRSFCSSLFQHEPPINLPNHSHNSIRTPLQSLQRKKSASSRVHNQTVSLPTLARSLTSQTDSIPSPSTFQNSHVSPIHTILLFTSHSHSPLNLYPPQPHHPFHLIGQPRAEILRFLACYTFTRRNASEFGSLLPYSLRSLRRAMGATTAPCLLLVELTASRRRRGLSLRGLSVAMDGLLVCMAQ